MGQTAGCPATQSERADPQTGTKIFGCVSAKKRPLTLSLDNERVLKGGQSALSSFYLNYRLWFLNVAKPGKK